MTERICGYKLCRKGFKPGKAWSKYCTYACGNNARVRKYRKKKRAAAKRRKRAS